MSSENQNILNLINEYIKFSKTLDISDENVREISKLIRNSEESTIKEYNSRSFNKSLISKKIKNKNVVPFFRILTLNYIRRKKGDFNGNFKSLDIFNQYCIDFIKKLKNDQFPHNFADQIQEVKEVKSFIDNGNEYKFNLEFVKKYIKIDADKVNNQLEKNINGFKFFRHFNLYSSDIGKELKSKYSYLWTKLYISLVDLLGLNPDEYFIGNSSFFQTTELSDSDNTWGALVKKEFGEYPVELDKKKLLQLKFIISPRGLKIGVAMGSSATNQFIGYIEKISNSKKEQLLLLIKKLQEKYPEDLIVKFKIKDELVNRPLNELLDNEIVRENIFDLFKLNYMFFYENFKGNMRLFDEIIKNLFKLYSVFTGEEEIGEISTISPQSFLKKNLTQNNFLINKDEIIQLLEKKLVGINIKKIVEKILKILTSGKNVILYGAPGTGKTDIIETIFKYLNEKLEIIRGIVFTTASSDWTIFETIGGLVPYANKLDFNPGIFLKCFREDKVFTNKWIIVDELNRANIDKAFGYFFSLLSDQEVELPFETMDKKIVKVIPLNKWKNDGLTEEDIIDKTEENSNFDRYFISPNWRLGGTINSSDKASLHQLSHAFIRRFGFISIPLPDVDSFMKEFKDRFISSNEKQEHLKIIWKNVNMYYEIGPSVIIDMDKLLEFENMDIFDAFEAYILPQIDTLPDDIINDLLDNLKSEFSKDDTVNESKFDRYRIEYQ